MNRTMHALKNVVCYGLAVMFVINLAGAAQDASLTGSNVVAWTCAVLGVLVFALARSESAVPAIMRPSGGAFL
ncbi:hypothetical protein LLG95_18010, partial [bacterium]|nr:hypothetical protein [bacterium]